MRGSPVAPNLKGPCGEDNVYEAYNTGQMVEAPTPGPLKQPLSSESYQLATGGPEPRQRKGEDASGLEEK